MNTGQSVRELLIPIVGEFVAKTSVSMASKKLGKTADSITAEDLPSLAEALRPALRTLIGMSAGDSLAEQVRTLGKR